MSGSDDIVLHKCKSLIPDNKLLKPIFKTDLKNARKLTKTMVCLPSHNELKIKDIHKIGNLFKEFNF